MNIELSGLAALAQRLLRPDQVTIDEAQRDHARRRVEDAAHAGSIGGSQAEAAMSRLERARNRGDLRRALGSVPRATPSDGLVAALRGAGALWLVATAVQIVVWLMIGIIGFHWAGPWWLWTLVPGLFIVGPLWWLNETYYQAPTAARSPGLTSGGHAG